MFHLIYINSCTWVRWVPAGVLRRNGLSETKIVAMATTRESRNFARCRWQLARQESPVSQKVPPRLPTTASAPAIEVELVEAGRAGWGRLSLSCRPAPYGAAPAVWATCGHQTGPADHFSRRKFDHGSRPVLGGRVLNCSAQHSTLWYPQRTMAAASMM